MLNSVFLHHCVEAGLDLAMVNPNHITPYGEITEAERALADDLVFNRREDALELFIAHFETKGEEEAAEVADPTADMEPEEALHWHILRRKKDGVEDWIDQSVEKIGAVPTLNTVLLPAMKEVGDKFGAGELILPFVLQSAEVMKKAVKHLEQFLEKAEGYTKGKVVLATVYGDGFIPTDPHGRVTGLDDVFAAGDARRVQREGRADRRGRVHDHRQAGDSGRDECEGAGREQDAGQGGRPGPERRTAQLRAREGADPDDAGGQIRQIGPRRRLERPLELPQEPTRRLDLPGALRAAVRQMRAQGIPRRGAHDELIVDVPAISPFNG